MDKVFSIKSLEKVECDSDLFPEKTKKGFNFVSGVKFLTLHNDSLFLAQENIQIDFNNFPSLIELKFHHTWGVNFIDIAHNLISLEVTGYIEGEDGFKIDFDQFPSLKNLKVIADDHCVIDFLNEKGQLENFTHSAFYSRATRFQNCSFKNLKNLILFDTLFDYFKNSSLRTLKIDSIYFMDDLNDINILKNFGLLKLEIDYKSKKQVESLRKLKIPEVILRFSSYWDYSDPSLKTMGDVFISESRTYLKLKPGDE